MPDRLGLYAAARRVETSQRRVYFGPSNGWMDTPVVDRSALDGSAGNGPLIIEEYDSTTVVPPGWRVSVDGWSNIILER